MRIGTTKLATTRLALLSSVAAALSFIGAAGAQAETIYVTEPDAIAAPGYVYAAPAPYDAPRYVVTEPAAPVLVDPQASYVVVEPQAVVEPQPYAVSPPLVVTPRNTYVAPREVYRAPREVYRTPVAPRSSGVVTTGFSPRSCFIDLNGFERC